MSEIVPVITLITILVGTWKVFDISRDLGEIKANLANQKEDLREHGSRIKDIEAGRYPRFSNAGNGSGDRPAAV